MTGRAAERPQQRTHPPSADSLISHEQTGSSSTIPQPASPAPGQLQTRQPSVAEMREYLERPHASIAKRLPPAPCQVHSRRFASGQLLRARSCFPRGCGRLCHSTWQVCSVINPSVYLSEEKTVHPPLSTLRSDRGPESPLVQLPRERMALPPSWLSPAATQACSLHKPASLPWADDPHTFHRFRLTPPPAHARAKLLPERQLPATTGHSAAVGTLPGPYRPSPPWGPPGPYQAADRL